MSKRDPLVTIGGSSIVIVIGLIVVLGLDTSVGIIAALAAGAGHDPGVALSSLFRSAPLCGSFVALCATMLCGWWLIQRYRQNDKVVVRRSVFNKTNGLIVIVGTLGMIIVVGLSASIMASELCRHIGLFLRTQWQNIGAYMSSVGWYFLFLAGVAFLCGFLAGLLGIVIGGLSGGLFSTAADILMRRVRR